MKIVRCYIENFGKLREQEIEFKDGLNVINEKNGVGKTTLAAFIKVMFFGFASEGKRSELENERKRYQPWQGGVYGGQLTFCAKGKEYTIARTFGKKEKDDTFAIYDEMTKLESQDYSTRLGEELLQIDHDSFLRTVFIAQNDCDTAVTDSINAKLGNLAENTDDINNYEVVHKKLNDTLNSLTARRKTGLIYKKNSEINELKENLRKGESIEQATIRLTLKRDEEQKNRIQLEKEQLKIQAELTKLSGYKDLQAKKERYEDLCIQYTQRNKQYQQEKAYFKGNIPTEETLNRYQKKLLQLEELKLEIAKNKLTKEEEDKLKELQHTFQDGIPKEHELESGIPSVLLIGIVLLIAGGVVFTVNTAAGIAGLLIGAILMGMGYSRIKKRVQKQNEFYALKDSIREYQLLMKRKRDYETSNLRQQHKVLSDEVSEFLSCYCKEESVAGERYSNQFQMQEIREHFYRVSDSLKELNRVKQWKEEFETIHDVEAIRSLQAIEETQSMEALNEKLGHVTRQIGITIQNISDYNARLDKICDDREQLAEAEEQLSEALEELEGMKKTYHMVEKTQEYLEKAKESFTARYMSPVRQGFEKYYKLITREEAANYQIDANMDITAKELGLQRNVKMLSQGYRNLIGITMRMALVDAMFQEEKPFVIFDDPFVNLDEKKLQGGLEFLKNVAKEYQVIYFTCHDCRTV